MSVATSKKFVKSETNVSVASDPLLWPEWSDATLNKENWAIPKNGPDGFFYDTQLVQLPPSLEAHEWIRAKNLSSLTEPLTVFNLHSEPSDLITNNKHILHSEFVRWFISAIINLQYCGLDGLEVSGENNNFVWNGLQQSWRGWMNVYSMNKAGKGAHHRPTVNPNGKYIVRLYFLGFWRRIVVDDMIPINDEGLPLLPRTANNSEIWPMILAKGLLKLCSLTWSENREIVDYHPVACLTGWICLQLDIGYLSPQDKWDFLRKYAEHFEWKPEVEQESQEASRSEVTSEEKKPRGKRSRDSPRTKKSKSSDPSKRTEDTRSKKSRDTGRSRRTKDSAKQPKVPTKPQPVTLCLGLGDMKRASPEAVPGLSPCWSHFIYVAQSRDVPLDPNDVKPPLARWKLFRWLRWAIEEGLIDPVEYFVPIRSLKIVSSLKEHAESVINRYSDTITGHTQNGDTNHKTKTEKVDSKSKSRDISKDPSVKIPAEDPPEDSFWADFNKMEPFVKDIHFFYKPDYFQYTARISDLVSRQQRDQRSEAKKSSRKDSRRSSPSGVTFREPEFSESYCWPQKMSRSRNEPLYVFTDSLEEKFFLINFSTFQVSIDPKRTVENGSKSRESIVSTAENDYLTIEKHSWFQRPKKCICLALISTAGTRSTVVELEPGRHLLRVYCHSESRCFVTISSDTAFHLGDRRRMYQLMSTESERVDQMVRHVSNSVSSAYQSFGTARYPEALKNYYSSYMPSVKTANNKSKTFYNQIHEYFIEEEVKLIQKILPADEAASVIRALRIFILNRVIGLECFNAIRMMLKALREFSLSKDSMHMLYGNSQEGSCERNYAATLIQSFFKMLIMRKYKAIHDPSHKEHQEVVGNLLKLAEMFNYNKGESLANQVLRNMLKQHDELHDMYPWTNDFEYTIQVQEVNGTLANVKPNQWIPIARPVVNPPLTGSGLTAIELFVNLPKYSVRVFSNKTGREMLRVVNNVVPLRYQHETLGYTIFGYGWSEDEEFKELPWTLSIISIKGQPMLHLLDDEVPISASTVLPVLLTQELSSNYIPNKAKRIAKWIIKVAKPSIVSLRLRASYDHVKIKFRLTDAEEYVLSEVEGVSAVILPAVYLGLWRKVRSMNFESPRDIRIGSIRSDKKNLLNGAENNEDLDDIDEDEDEESVDERIYYVEAFVLEDSWPLTKSEWAVVTDIRILPSGSIANLKPSVSSTSRLSKSELSRKRASKLSVDSQAIEPPYWVLQVVTDSTSEIEVSRDRTKELEIARMKEAWAQENPDSLQRGRELREAFLKEHEFKPLPSDAESYESAKVETIFGSKTVFKSESSLIRRRSSTLSRRSSKRDSARTSIDCLETSTGTLGPRTPKPTASLRRLRSLDLTAYKYPEEEEDIPWMKTEQDEEVLKSSRLMNIIYAKEDYLHVMEDMHNLMYKQKKECQMLYDEHNDSLWERKDFLEEVYEARKAYIDNAKPVSARSGSKKSRKSKKSKKA